MNTPSDLLWAAAVGALIACNGDTPAAEDDDDTPQDSEADTDVPADTDPILSTETREDLTFEQFEAECEARGGMVQVHATCAGNNACAGMSFNKWSKELIEHTCRGLNTCGGASCVQLPDDQGRDPSTLYAESCGTMCHGDGFSVYVPPEGDEAAALATFQARSTETHMAMIAFGVNGVLDPGISIANMPAFYQKFSRDEIAGLAAYVKTLELSTTVYGTPDSEAWTDL